MVQRQKEILMAEMNKIKAKVSDIDGLLGVMEDTNNDFSFNIVTFEKDFE